MNVVTAEVTTAREIGQQEKAALQSQLKAATGKEVRLRFRTDPAIIGGASSRASVVWFTTARSKINWRK